MAVVMGAISFCANRNYLILEMRPKCVGSVIGGEENTHQKKKKSSQKKKRKEKKSEQRRKLVKEKKTKTYQNTLEGR